MRFSPCELEGVFLVELEPNRDERGFFARSFCAEEFAAHGLMATVAQANMSFNRERGTVRGLHLQVEPAPEEKLFRCIAGVIYSVVVDLRPGSSTHGAHTGIRLDSERGASLYVPPLCATGYQALVDGATALYFVSQPYAPESERGLRYDDPALGIAWPLSVTQVSEKDRSWPLLEAAGTALR
jgi:dTDP-4-dehydrorhamnose 3,5-epimerase